HHGSLPSQDAQALGRGVLREAEDGVRAEAVGVEQDVDRGTLARGAQLIERIGRTPVRLPNAEADERIALRGDAGEHQARAFGGAPDGGDVHARGEVVGPWSGERVGDEPVTREPSDGAGAAAGEEVRLLAAVVEDDDVPLHERRGELRDPALGTEAYLPP